MAVGANCVMGLREVRSVSSAKAVQGLWEGSLRGGGGGGGGGAVTVVGEGRCVGKADDSVPAEAGWGGEDEGVLVEKTMVQSKFCWIWRRAVMIWVLRVGGWGREV